MSRVLAIAALASASIAAASSTSRAAADNSFRATGNEPSWRLEIGDTEMVLLTNLGETRTVAPVPTPEVAAGARTYTTATETGDLTVTVTDGPCIDSMSGMPHPNTVTVVLAGKTLSGCGGDPASLLRGAPWSVKDIGGVALVKDSRVTLAFAPDGGVSGAASCNNFNSDYVLSGEGLTISKGAKTMMTCDTALMDQEQRFLATLAQVQRFELTADGTLVLRTGSGSAITARRE